MSRQIKSKKRVVDFGEVYTADREVNAMLDMVANQAASITTTFLEPACGNGNFVAAILGRKLQTVAYIHECSEQTMLNTLRAVASIYAVDIQADNVYETRNRLRTLAENAYDNMTSGCVHIKRIWLKKLDIILDLNVMCGDTLTAKKNDGSDMWISEWTIADSGSIIRDEVRYRDILDGTDADRNRHIIHRYRMQLNKPAAA